MKTLRHQARKLLMSGRVAVLPKAETPAMIQYSGDQQILMNPILIRLKRLRKKFITALVTLIALATAYFDFRPHVDVEPNSPLRSYTPTKSWMATMLGESNPSSTFVIRNESKYGLQDVKAVCLGANEGFSGPVKEIVVKSLDNNLNPVDDGPITGESELIARLASGSQQPLQCLFGSLQVGAVAGAPTWARTKVMVTYKFWWLFDGSVKYSFVTENNSDGSLQWIREP